MLKLFADEDRFTGCSNLSSGRAVHDTQPWWFRIVADDRIDICARFGAAPDSP